MSCIHGNSVDFRCVKRTKLIVGVCVTRPESGSVWDGLLAMETFRSYQRSWPIRLTTALMYSYAFIYNRYNVRNGLIVSYETMKRNVLHNFRPYLTKFNPWIIHQRSLSLLHVNFLQKSNQIKANQSPRVVPHFGDCCCFSARPWDRNSGHRVRPAPQLVCFALSMQTYVFFSSSSFGIFLCSPSVRFRVHHEQHIRAASCRIRLESQWETPTSTRPPWSQK